MPSEGVLIAGITTIGTVVVAYVVNVLAKRSQTKKDERRGTDRFDELFSGYEHLIKQKNIEDDRKAAVIVTLNKTIERLEKSNEAKDEEIEVVRDLLKQTQGDFMESREETKLLRLQLEAMRKEHIRLKKMGIA